MKYCIRRDRPMGSLGGEQILTGCTIYGVHHDCEKCPNLIEMGDGGVSYSASDVKQSSDTIGKSEDLEKEIDKLFPKPPFEGLPAQGVYSDEQIRNIARHFAEWGAKHLK